MVRGATPVFVSVMFKYALLHKSGTMLAGGILKLSLAPVARALLVPAEAAWIENERDPLWLARCWSFDWNFRAPTDKCLR